MKKGHCIHTIYKPGGDPQECVKGHDVVTLAGGGTPGWGTRTPCNRHLDPKGGPKGECPDYLDPTDAQIKEWEEMAEQAFAAVVGGRCVDCGTDLVAAGPQRICPKCRKVVALVCTRGKT